MFSPLSPGPWVWGLGVWDLGFRVQGLGFRVWGLWFGVRGFGFRTLNRPKHQAPKEVKEVQPISKELPPKLPRQARVTMWAIIRDIEIYK